VLFLFGGFTLAYMFSEFALSRMLHPLHWATAGLIAALLYAGSYIWMLRPLYLQQAARPAKQASDERR